MTLDLSLLRTTSRGNQPTAPSPSCRIRPRMTTLSTAAATSAFSSRRAQLTKTGAQHLFPLRAPARRRAPLGPGLFTSVHPHESGCSCAAPQRDPAAASSPAPCPCWLSYTQEAFEGAWQGLEQNWTCDARSGPGVQTVQQVGESEGAPRGAWCESEDWRFRCTGSYRG